MLLPHTTLNVWIFSKTLIVTIYSYECITMISEQYPEMDILSIAFHWAGFSKLRAAPQSGNPKHK